MEATATNLRIRWLCEPATDPLRMAVAKRELPRTAAPFPAGQGHGWIEVLVVTCDPRDATESLAKRHPALICEVLSESTEAYDRGGKFAAYRSPESLNEYLLIDSRRHAVEVFRRQPGGWLLAPVTPDGALERNGLGFQSCYGC